MVETSYKNQIIEKRRQHDKDLIACPQNWLSLIGRFPLKAGDNYFGNGDRNEIVIPELPYKKCGLLHLDGKKVTLLGVCKETTINGKHPVSRPLRAEPKEQPDLIEIGSICMRVLHRDDLFFLRVWNTKLPKYTEFKGLNYYPVNAEFRIRGTFVPFDPPKPFKFIDATGLEHTSEYAGEVKFSVNGTELALQAEDAMDELLLNFTDETKKDTTYPGGRYLAIVKPQGQEVELDFNLAANWPCAYTDYAACPRPNPENHLPVRIEAGEMRFH